MSKMRIQKFLAEAGVASRRAVERMVLDDRITVNGRFVRELPCFVTPDDDVCVDGQTIRKRMPKRIYFLLNKPRGVVCTQRDPGGRPRAVDLIPRTRQRVYCVGRLDAESTGLIVLTNDGELTEYLTHPRYGVPKTYVVEVDGRLDERAMTRLKSGVNLDGRRTQGARVRVLHQGHGRSSLEITLSEGRNREVRRVLARLGHKVRRLKRVAIGPITDKGLKIGSVRQLRPAEVRRLRGSGQTRRRKSADTGEHTHDG